MGSTSKNPELLHDKHDGAAVYTPGISERRSGVSKWSHQDYLGSTKALTNSSETVTDTRQYDAFGLQTGSTGSTPTPFGFAGGWGYQSDETGLQLLGHRYYDPSTGRFLTRDPIKDGRNWYGYCKNNPIKSVDPRGLDYIFIVMQKGGANMGSHAHIGIWDGVNGHPIKWFGFYADGIHEDDGPSNGDPANTVAIQVTPAQRRKVERQIYSDLMSMRSGQGKNYDLGKNNCAVWIRTLLQRAWGEDLGFEGDIEALGDVNTPKGLVDAAKTFPGATTTMPWTWPGVGIKGGPFPSEWPGAKKDKGSSSSR